MYLIKNSQGYFSINLQTGKPKFIDNINFAYSYATTIEAEKIVDQLQKLHNIAATVEKY